MPNRLVISNTYSDHSVKRTRSLGDGMSAFSRRHGKGVRSVLARWQQRWMPTPIVAHKPVYVYSIQCPSSHGTESFSSYNAACFGLHFGYNLLESNDINLPKWWPKFYWNASKN